MSRRIQVSEKVFAAIWSLAAPDFRTEDAILENLLRTAPACKPVFDRADAADRDAQAGVDAILAAEPERRRIKRPKGSA